MKQFSWKIGGEAGFGIMTTGLMFSKIAARRGYRIFDFVEYPSLIRGGHNTYEVTFSSDEVTLLKDEIDVLVCLNKETYELHKGKLAKDACVVFDPDEFSIDDAVRKVAVPFGAILKELSGQIIMKNTIALGASLALFGSELSELHDLLEKQFGRKGAQVVEFNQNFAQRGYAYVREQYASWCSTAMEKRSGGEQMVISGNEAFAYGSVVADTRFYAAYPMTPSTGVLTTLAAWQKKTGMVVRHSEDEIAVVNSALGSSFMGVRSGIGTSGGGFALMVEALSLAGIAELPLVVFIAQRPGPATGMPTWTEQGDLLFAVHAGHGEFQKIVLAPGTHEELITLGAHAYDLADRYQIPVIVLSDMLLSESHKSISRSEIDSFASTYTPDRGKLITTAGKDYKRYALSEDGISPRLVPGAAETYYQANSYEHHEDGHTSESAADRIAQATKRQRKMDQYLANDFAAPVKMGNYEKAKTVFVGWGSTRGVIQETLRQYNQREEVAGLCFTHLYPLNRPVLENIFGEDKRFILVENNMTAQLGKLLMQETGIELKEKVTRFDGRPLTVADLMGSVQK